MVRLSPRAALAPALFAGLMLGAAALPAPALAQDAPAAAATAETPAPGGVSLSALKQEGADLGAGVHRVEIRLVGANPAAIGDPAILIDVIEATELV